MEVITLHKTSLYGWTLQGKGRRAIYIEFPFLREVFGAMIALEIDPNT